MATWAHLCLALLLQVFGESICRADTAGQKSVRSDPKIIALDVAREAGARALEQRFITELALVLDPYVLIRVDSEAGAFMGLPLSEQLKRIEQRMTEQQAAAAVWIEGTESGVVSLHLAVFSTGRALVRIVEVEMGPDAARELALAAQELLSQAYMFDAAPSKAAPPVDQSEQIVPSPSPKRAPLRSGYLLFGVLRGGVYGHTGPSFSYGGGGGVEVWFHQQVFVRGQVAVSAGPNASDRQSEIHAWGMQPEVVLGYGRHLGPVRVGPVLGIGAAWTDLEITAGQGDNQSYSKWSVLGGLGLDLWASLVDGVDLIVDARAGIYGIREQFERDSDGEILLSTPFVDWRVQIGLVFYPK